MKKFILVILFLLIPTYVYAQESEEVYTGTINDVFEVECSEALDSGYTCFEYSVKVDGKEEDIRSIPVLSDTGESRFNIGDRVYVSYFTDGFGSEGWSVTGFVRNSSILIMVTIFSLLALIIGRRQGFGSLLSLAFTVFVLYGWAIPRILNGGNILLIGVITVCVVLIVIMYASHGFNRKSSIAVLSTLIGILIVSLIAKIFISMIKIDGLGSEEAFLLQSQTGGSINLAEIFFVSILIGAMGVLDDVVVSQISAINELHVANPRLTSRQLFLQAMNIGRDHLSSMVNTLFIAYAGSSFALVILLTYSSGGIGNILRTDAIAEEIVRTLSASIGILLIVPITSLVSAYLIPKTEKMI
jgi:uncharacterized membrane protein